MGVTLFVAQDIIYSYVRSALMEDDIKWHLYVNYSSLILDLVEGRDGRRIQQVSLMDTVRSPEFPCSGCYVWNARLPDLHSALCTLLRLVELNLEHVSEFRQAYITIF